MPSLTYAPYEELLFFQNVLQHGHDSTSLETISNKLNENQLVRDSKAYDALKFSTDALQQLYNSRVKANIDSNGVKNESASTNGVPKTKTSGNPEPDVKHGDDQFLEQFVDQLYTKFKDETIQDLRKQEADYQRLQGEIATLEERAKAELVQTQQAKSVAASSAINAQPEPSDPVAAQLQASLDAVNDVDNTIKTAAVAAPSPTPVNLPPKSERGHPSPIPKQSTTQPSSASTTPTQRHAQPVPSAQQASIQPAPRVANQHLQPLPLSPNHAAQSIAPYPQPPYPQHMMHPAPALQRVPSHEGYGQQRALSQGRNSPLSQQTVQSYQPTQNYQPSQAGWSPPNPQNVRQSGSPYPGQHSAQIFYPQAQTPIQHPFPQPHPQTEPIQHVQPRRPQLAGQFPMSASTTPIPRSNSRLSMLRSGNNTPWKKSPGTPRARSPSRLEREISPLSDRDSPPPTTSPKRRGRPPKSESVAALKALAREQSATPTANASRSQSVLSTTSDVPDPPKRRPGRPPKVKPELPSTPAPTANSDSEQQQRSSGRRGRPRGNTTTSKTEPTPSLSNKRKRDHETTSPVPLGGMARGKSGQSNALQYETSNLILVCKTFNKTTSTLLSQIQSHKLGGIFAKPVRESDAPGYSSVVERPQDLKSIKAAISKGSKAAASLIEEVETKEGDSSTEATAVAETTDETFPRSIGNGYFYVEKNEDLLPPKGIVNLEQLEMELVRIFANAVMFNPLTSSERGFGRSLRLRKRGGELLAHGARKSTPVDEEEEEAGSEPATVATTSESESSSGSADETGIIADAREMFEDVEKMITSWKAIEVERIGDTAQSAHERQVSVSASSAAEEVDESGASNFGSMRKRRKVADH